MERPGFSKMPPIDFTDYVQRMLKQGVASELPEPRVFDMKAIKTPDSISMASYPRSGNTLLRTWVERVTGTFSGSDGNNQGALH